MSEEYEFSIDIGRPDLLSEELHRKWRELHKYVDDRADHIEVSSAYHFVTELLESGLDYGGGGMKYMFWFEEEDELNGFMRKCVEIFGNDAVFPILYRNNITDTMLECLSEASGWSVDDIKERFSIAFPEGDTDV